MSACGLDIIDDEDNHRYVIIFMFFFVPSGGALSQKNIAQELGISEGTYRSAVQGKDKFEIIIGIMRVLGELANLDSFLQETPFSPIALLKMAGKKRHYQSLCAMAHADYRTPGHYSYEQAFSLMRTLRMRKSQALEMMVFNIIARNQDDHTKNFGFLMDSAYRWQLAPAFDLVYSYRPDSPWVNAYQLTLNGKRDHFVRDALLVPAATFRKEAIHIIEEVKTIVSQWAHYAEKAGVFPAFAREIRAAHRLGV